MSNTISKPMRTKKRNEESTFFWFALGFSIVIAIGFGALLVAMSRQGQTAYVAIADFPVGTSPVKGPIMIPPDRPRHLIKFSLTDCTGRTITRKDLEGKFLVVSFLFTACSVDCPIVSYQMERIQELVTNQPDVELVSLTVDPEDDTAPVLARYGQSYGADTNRWLFLTGNEDTIQNLIGTSFLAPDTTGAFAFMPGNFAHTERIVLVDPQGKIRDYFDGMSSNAAPAVVAEINRLRKQMKK